MFGTCLSSRKQADSTSLLLPRLSFSAPKRLKAKLRFTLCVEWTSSARRFVTLWLYLLFFTTASSCYVLSTLGLTCMLSSAWGSAVTPHPDSSRDDQNIKIQAESGALQTVTTTHVQRPRSDDWSAFLNKKFYWLCLLKKWILQSSQSLKTAPSVLDSPALFHDIRGFFVCLFVF